MSLERLVRQYLAAVERFDVDAMVERVHPDIRVHELPNRINPSGSQRNLQAMQLDLPKGQKILRQQMYLIDDVLEKENKLVLRGRWEGVLAVPIGRLQVGDTMVAHICMHFRARNGLIIEQRTYDCYEDFSAA